MLAASYYGADERVLASLAESFPAMDWPKLANYMVGRVVVHGHRRAREMEEVAETLRAAILLQATSGTSRHAERKAPPVTATLPR
jgi:hypothetical protein